MPPLTSLRAFFAFCETGSMAKAGAQLNVTHAAISQQIKSLESFLGLVLLDRSRRDAVPTAEGQVLAAALGRGFADISRTIDELTGAASERPLQISVTPAFASSWLVPRLELFRARHPSVSLMVDPSAEMKAFDPGGLDLAVRYGLGDWPGLVADLLFLSPIAVIAAPALIAGRDITSAEDLRDLPWLQEVGTSETTEWLASQGVEGRLKHGITSFPGSLMLEAARAGQGVAITARLWAEPDIRSGRLTLLFEEPGAKGYYLVHPDLPLRPPAEAFARWIKSEAKTASDPR